MKKIIAVLFVLLLCLSMAACRKTPSFSSSYISENNMVVSNVNEAVINSESSMIVSSQETPNNSTPIESTPNTGSSSSTITSTITNTIPKPNTTVTNTNDATQANNNRVNSYIEEQLQHKTEITQTDIDKIISELVSKDGVTYHNVNSINDTVSMINLYYLPMEGKFKALDTKVMNSLINGKAEEIDTGFLFSANGKELIQEYSNQLYVKNTITINGFSVRGDAIFIDTKDLIEQKIALENSSYYKAVQQAIKECEIYKGMLQRDAIIKFNEYICNKVEYDYKDYSCTLDAFFFQGKAICNSYTQVFEILCRTVGIDAEFITDKVIVDNMGHLEPHAWNKVTFSGGKVAYFDTCWNDSDIIINGKVYKKTDRYMFVNTFSDRSPNGAMCQPMGYYPFKSN